MAINGWVCWSANVSAKWPYENDFVKRSVAIACGPTAISPIASHPRLSRRRNSGMPRRRNTSRKRLTRASSMTTICAGLRWPMSCARKYVSAPHIVAATPTNTTEKRSISPTRPAGAAASDFIVGTAIVITPLAAGAEIGRTAGASEGLLSSRLYGRPRSGSYAFTGSVALVRSPALPPIRELHPCPEDQFQHTRSVFEVTFSGKDHGDAGRIGGGDRLPVFH